MDEENGLSRFVTEHQRDYPRALMEIKNGKKVSHWMWYIFPQIRGLGFSSYSRFYAINDLDEAKAFLNDEYLGGSLREICSALLKLKSCSATEIFGSPDDMKLRSSMTLFSCACEHPSVFDEVLDKFFGGVPDIRTLHILGREST